MDKRFLKNFYKGIILFPIVCIFLFMAFGVQFFHNHNDLEYRSDCSACKWPSISLFTLFVIFVLIGISLNFGSFFPDAEPIIIKAYQSFRYLRSPPQF